MSTISRVLAVAIVLAAVGHAFAVRRTCGYTVEAQYARCPACDPQQTIACVQCDIPGAQCVGFSKECVKVKFVQFDLERVVVLKNDFCYMRYECKPEDGARPCSPTNRCVGKNPLWGDGSFENAFDDPEFRCIQIQ